MPQQPYMVTFTCDFCQEQAIRQVHIGDKLIIPYNWSRPNGKMICNNHTVVCTFIPNDTIGVITVDGKEI